MRSTIVAVVLGVICIAGSGSAFPADTGSDAATEADIDRGRHVWKKAKCAFCHGWAGDGAGHPRSPGVAANLRESALDKASMREIIRCGIPGSEMPYHERLAYTDDRCFGMTRQDFEPGTVPNRGKPVSDEDMDDLIAFIMTEVRGRGPVTRKECEAYFKPGSRNCLVYRE